LDDKERVVWLARHDWKDDPGAVKLLRMLVPVEEGEDEHGPFTRFTCKYFDTETYNCRIYADRPKMCQDYPYEDKPCAYEGCTLGRDAGMAVIP
jgi:Fe-S-cluster containining protein